MISMFHTSAGASFDRFRVWFWRAMLCVGVLAFLLGLRLAARGGCSLPPDLPQNIRRDKICVLLGRGPDCRIRVKDTLAVTIASNETDFSVYLGNEFVGSWPIFEGVPVDLSQLDRQRVEDALVFETGTPELQHRLRYLYRCRKVAFVDHVMTWEPGVTTAVLACAS